jgi:peroxiredoxin 5
MNAWGKSLDSSKASGIRFLGDPSGEFTRVLETEFDAAAMLGTNRSKRYAIVTNNGKVEKVSIEPDNVGVSSKYPEY